MKSFTKIYFILLMILFCFPSLIAQRQFEKFNNIGIENGLSLNWVFDILQDNKGFIWIATWDGLNRYDGYEFKVYKHIDGDSTSLRINKIICLLQDHSGRIWVGTAGGGLSLFNPATDNFTTFIHDASDTNSIGGNDIYSLFEDSKNRIWIGTYPCGLTLLNGNELESKPLSPSNVKFVNFKEVPNNPQSYSGNGAVAITEDNAHRIWIASNNGGLNEIMEPNNSPEKIKFKHFFQRSADNPKPENTIFESIKVDQFHPNIMWLVNSHGSVSWFEINSGKFFNKYPIFPLPDKLQKSIIESLFFDNDGKYWFGTYRNGIFKITYPGEDKNQFSYEHYLKYPEDHKNNALQDIVKFYEDRAGMVWVGSASDGLYTFQNNKNKFLAYAHNELNKNSLSGSTVYSVLEDNENRVWVGTSMGLDRYDPKTQKYTHYYYQSGNSRGIGGDIIYSIFQDKYGIIWIGTSGGLDKYNPGANSFTHFQHNPSDSKSISAGQIIKIFSDSKNTIWLGSWGGGLNKMIPGSNDGSVRFQHYRFNRNDTTSISNDDIMSIAETPDGKLWVGTAYGGLNKLVSDYLFNKDGSIKKPVFKRYTHNLNDPNSLSNNDVRAICVDKSGTLWLGTFGGGLNKFVPPNNSNEQPEFIRFRQTEGLPNDVVRGILQDDSGYLWIGTANGLSKFDPDNGTFWNFDASDGLQTSRFEDAQFKNKKTGRMYFGGIGGLISFVPSEIKINRFKPAIVITSCKHYNKKTNSMIDVQGISFRKKITLSYDDNILNFEFSALNYDNSAKNKYAYKLEGYNNNWIQLGHKREVTFTNLDPGNYKLRVKGSNDDGVWNDTGTTLEIIVNPPWWRTNWAYGAYIFLLFVGIFITDRIMRRKVIRKERDIANQREAELIKKQAGELQTIDRLVRVINRAENLENLFNSLLQQTMNIIPNAEKAAVFLRDKKDGLFRVAFTAGYEVKDLENISFTYNELNRRYSENSEEAEKGIYIIRNTENLFGDEKLSSFNRSKSMLVMAVEQEGTIEAFVVFDNFSSRDAFDKSAANLLNRFHEHAVSAISKAQAIKSLQDKNEEIVKTQEQLLTQQKLASLGALTAGIAHEIKNPLNFVNNFSELSSELLEEIKTELDKGNKEEIIEILNDLKQNLERINQHGKRADSIVKGMLLHSRGSSGEKTLTDINDLLDEYVNLAYHGMRAQDKEFNITIEKDFDETLEKINIVPQDISRVFLNIINNACYAAYHRKKKNSDDNFSPTLIVSTKNLYDKIEIEIADNGDGIPKDIIDKIFQPFFTTKPAGEGTGLGLSLSYDIVTKVHNGELKVETVEGNGTRFIVTLPKK